MKDGRCSLKKIINVETNLLIMDADKTTFIQGTSFLPMYVCVLKNDT
jgi:hypothetical protein